MFQTEPKPAMTLAAAYVRMSTEHPRSTTSDQMDVIREYAKSRGIRIVNEYSDGGNTGQRNRGGDSRTHG